MPTASSVSFTLAVTAATATQGDTRIDPDPGAVPLTYIGFDSLAGEVEVDLDVDRDVDADADADADFDFDFDLESDLR